MTSTMLPITSSRRLRAHLWEVGQRLLEEDTLLTLTDHANQRHALGPNFVNVGVTACGQDCRGWPISITDDGGPIAPIGRGLSISVSKEETLCPECDEALLSEPEDDTDEGRVGFLIEGQMVAQREATEAAETTAALIQAGAEEDAIQVALTACNDALDGREDVEVELKKLLAKIKRRQKRQGQQWSMPVREAVHEAEGDLQQRRSQAQGIIDARMSQEAERMRAALDARAEEVRRQRGGDWEARIQRRRKGRERRAEQAPVTAKQPNHKLDDLVASDPTTVFTVAEGCHDG